VATQFFQVFGLLFESELELPELTKCSEPGRADVRISLGVVPECIESPISCGGLYEASATQFLLRLEGVANYLVESGSQITIEPTSNDPTELRVFLYSSCMGALLQQRGIVPLHASGVLTDRGALLFAGASGVGKSTLAAALSLRGFPVIADDIAAITLDSQGKAKVLPGIRRLKLWKQALSQLHLADLPLQRTRHHLEKYEYSPAPVGQGELGEDIAAIVFMGEWNESSIKIESVGRSDKLKRIISNTYRSRFLQGLKARPAHFQVSSTLGATVPMFSVTRPNLGFQIDRLIDEILTTTGCSRAQLIQ
jgi:hypothetical protein